ncbi:MAG: DUF4197 domain-containing protein [Nitrospina sp.]|nr:MAG: DUF4197 domain-containing protein [Nitrospina sp.]
MKKRFFILLWVIFFTALSGCAELNQMARSLDASLKTGGTDNTIAGLKEALSVATANAVLDVSKINGYLQNQAIKILLPEEIQKTMKVARKIGLGRLVDSFEESMNQAAEKAAPEARAIFLDAVRNITFDDALKILNGGDTAATDFLKSKTYNTIHAAFQPLIARSMAQVGVTRLYQQVMGPVQALPFQKPVTLDLDAYVTGKALDGLYFVVAEEEKKIRTDPSARVTALLKDVFGKKRG